MSASFELPDISSQRESDNDGIAALWLITLYLLLIIGGFAFFRSGRATIAGNPMSIPRSMFTAVNAATLTGFQQSVALESLKPAGQGCAAVLMIGGTFLILSVSTIAVARILRKRWSIGMILLFAALAQAFATVVGGFALRKPGGDLWPAMFQAASAFGNCGLTLSSVPGASDPQTYLVLLPLAALGALGLPVLIELATSVFHGSPLSKHSRVVLMSSAIAFVLASLGCFVLQLQGGSEVRPALAVALVASINSRTAGLPIEYVYSYSRAMQWVLIVLMFIGAAPASAAGGLKLTTLVVLFAGGRRALRGEIPGRTFGIALTWLAIFALLILFSMIWMLQSAPEISPDRALFVIVSAASNTGLSPDPLSVTRDNGYALATTMLLGRLFPIAVLWWMANTTNDADVIVA